MVFCPICHFAVSPCDFLYPILATLSQIISVLLYQNELQSIWVLTNLQNKDFGFFPDIQMTGYIKTKPNLAFSDHNEYRRYWELRTFWPSRKTGYKKLHIFQEVMSKWPKTQTSLMKSFQMNFYIVLSLQHISLYFLEVIKMQLSDDILRHGSRHRNCAFLRQREKRVLAKQVFCLSFEYIWIWENLQKALPFLQIVKFVSLRTDTTCAF